MADLIGQQLGQYQITALLGEGGMAAVYRAQQLNVKRDVAVKVIKHHLIDKADFVRRFEREAQTVASLSHPFIVKVFDYGQQDDLVYLVMELLTGGSLAELIRRRPLSLDTTSQVLDQVASALDYGHERGVIHRDLKPQNILLDEKGNAFLTDFGIVKLATATTALTHSGAAMGTPAYMAPEQWQGTPIDARADIYSLGVTLFEMLSGQLPFIGETPASTMYKHLQQPVPQVSTLRTDLPVRIDAVIQKALAKDPQQRFSSAGELAAAFKAALTNYDVPVTSPALQDEPTAIGLDTAQPTPPGSKPTSPIAPVRRRGIGLGLAALILVAVVGLMIVVLGGHGLATPTATASDTIQAASQTSVPVAALPSATATRLTATATHAPTLAPVPPTPMPTSTNTETPEPTATQSPDVTPTIAITPTVVAQGEKLNLCGDYICIDNKSLGLGNTYFGFGYPFVGLSWAPDGKRFVFSACLKQDAIGNPNFQCQGNIFISDRDGKVSIVSRGPEYTREPAWSPDGKWIAHEANNAIVMVHPDGTGRRTVVGNRTACIQGMAWSPDSQRLAWLEVRFCNPGSNTLPDHVWIVNRDGSGMKLIFQTTDLLLEPAMIAWSPDGQSLTVMLQNGTFPQINVNCPNSPSGCDQSFRKERDSIPESWLANFYPQWAGEAKGTASAATPQPIAVTASTSATPPQAILTPSSTQIPSRTMPVGSTSSALGQGKKVDTCGEDLCVFPQAGGNTPLGLGNTYTGFLGVSWSPDGSHIVFSACRLANLTSDKCQELFVADQDGKNVVPLTRNSPGHSVFTPVWSPDGKWIAFQDDGTLAIIGADGTGRRRVVPFLSTIGIYPSMWLPIAWSPDSKQIAMLMSVRHLDTLNMDPPTSVWAINRDGSGGVRIILKSAVPIATLAWSPDGKSVAVALTDNKAYRIDPDCPGKASGCDASSRTSLDSIPEQWLANFNPQWAGETVSR